MRKIKLLDMFCGAGGAAVGYNQAAKKLGYDITITGVDINDQPNYPFHFIKSDAIDYLKKNWKNFTHIHASPPCQQYSRSTAQFRKAGKTYPDLIYQIRKLMEQYKLPSVIENVPSAPIYNDIILRGDMFGLNVLRTRIFETINWFMMNPVMPPKQGSVKEGDYCSVFGKGSYRKSSDDKIPKFARSTVIETWQYAMGIDWMKTEKELAEAIPPAYTRYIGRDFFELFI